ncbi:sulfotransferase 1B1-like isoform X2 [Liolophura sinensis]|uniref:sulfotransferase 1B1-like isoform X2 n=1 Tax=Liolophura sinensis TaxID=3198878 RepID=UPI0031585684
MDVQEIYRADADGNTIHQLEIDGLILPVLPGLPERLAQLQNFRPRRTHWTWEMLNMLLRGQTEFMSYSKDQIMFEFVDQHVIDSKPAPRVINSHLPFPLIPRSVLNTGNKIIHVMRNPKDVAVSCYNHHYSMYSVWKYDGNWGAYLQLFLQGHVGWCCAGEGWFGYVREWEEGKKHHPGVPILFIYYEDLQQDPMGTIKTLADFLDVQYDDTFYQEIIQKCSFDSMREVKNQVYSPSEKALWRDNSPRIFRKGKAGNWKEWFTVQQNEIFNRVFQEKMNNSTLKFDMYM